MAVFANEGEPPKDDRIGYAEFTHSDGSKGFVLLHPDNEQLAEKLDDLMQRLQTGELRGVRFYRGRCYAKYLAYGQDWTYKELHLNDFNPDGTPAEKRRLARLYLQQENRSGLKTPAVQSLTLHCGPTVPDSQNSVWYTPHMATTGEF